MSNRKAISKKIRFEVFKRDKFTCQYCGKTGPDVQLEVDHIIPVAEGGTNDISNLVTACFDCNRGKGKRTLSDDTAISKKKKELDRMQDHREMVEMMAQWQKELEETANKEIDLVDEKITSLTGGWGLSDQGKMNVRKMIKRFGVVLVLESTDIAFTKYYVTEYDFNKAFRKIGGICYNKQIGRGIDYYGY